MNHTQMDESVIHESGDSWIVQLVEGELYGGDATVDALIPATVRVTDHCVVAVANAGSEWTWALEDLDRVTHGRDDPWTIFAAPGVADHGVSVPAADMHSFRAALDRVLPEVDVIYHGDPRRDTVEPPPPPPPPPAVLPSPPPADDRASPWSPLEDPERDNPLPTPPPPPPSSDHEPATRVLDPTLVGDRPDQLLPDPGSLAGLEARSVSAWFGSHHVLDRVSLMMEPGEVTALIGPSGCGKSTFLRILNRMHEMIPSASLAGEVLLDGSDIYDSQRRVTDARRQIGMVFQKPNPFPAMSIYDNVVASYRLTGTKVSNDEKDAVVEETLRKAGLWTEVRDRLWSPGGGLSGGQQQRLCIARALAIRPRVLLMDEPCSALDPTSTRRIEQTIQELADEVTIVIVTHNMQQAARVSHQCAFFLAEAGTPGVIVEHGPTDAMFGSPQDERTEDYVNGRFG